jgi:hypothetical protein
MEKERGGGWGNGERVGGDREKGDGRRKGGRRREERREREDISRERFFSDSSLGFFRLGSNAISWKSVLVK